MVGKLLLCRAHLHHSLDESHAGCRLLLVRMNTEQVVNLNLYVMAVRRQEMNRAFLSHGFVADVFQCAHRGRICHAHLCCEVADAVYAAIPHYVFNIDVVADERLFVVVYVYHSDQSVAVLTEIIEERRVLSERVVTVVWEVAR